MLITENDESRIGGFSSTYQDKRTFVQANASLSTIVVSSTSTTTVCTVAVVVTVRLVFSTTTVTCSFGLAA